MTAKDLLHKFIEYEAKSNAGITQPLIRYKEIESLQKAFDLTVPNLSEVSQFRRNWLSDMDPIDYLYGEFIEDQPDDLYSEIKLAIASKVKGYYPKLQDHYFTVDTKKLEIAYNHLISFRIRIQTNESYENGPMLEGFDVGYYYSEIMIRELQEQGEEKLEEIDNLLWSILDPQKRNIDFNTLVKKFDYPR